MAELWMDKDTGPWILHPPFYIDFRIWNPCYFRKDIFVRTIFRESQTAKELSLFFYPSLFCLFHHAKKCDTLVDHASF